MTITLRGDQPLFTAADAARRHAAGKRKSFYEHNSLPPPDGAPMALEARGEL